MSFAAVETANLGDVSEVNRLHFLNVVSKRHLVVRREQSHISFQASFKLNVEVVSQKERLKNRLIC